MLALVSKFETADGQTLTTEEVKLLINQAAFDAQAPQINTDQGKKDRKYDAVLYKALASIRADLEALDLDDYLSIGNGKKGGRKGYSIKCIKVAFQKALWDKEKGEYIDTRAYLLECGITKPRTKTKRKLNQPL